MEGNRTATMHSMRSTTSRRFGPPGAFRTGARRVKSCKSVGLLFLPDQARPGCIQALRDYFEEPLHEQVAHRRVAFASFAQTLAGKRNGGYGRKRARLKMSVGLLGERGPAHRIAMVEGLDANRFPSGNLFERNVARNDQVEER